MSDIPTKAGERCSHGVLWPHECKDCQSEPRSDEEERKFREFKETLNRWSGKYHPHSGKGSDGMEVGVIPDKPANIVLCDENDRPVPAMTDPMGSHLEQPSTENMKFTETCVEMSRSDFEKLHNYHNSYPSGVYDGKMWKREDCMGVWYLLWYGPSSEPDKCSVSSRQIIVKP